MYYLVAAVLYFNKTMNRLETNRLEREWDRFFTSNKTMGFVKLMKNKLYLDKDNSGGWVTRL